MRHKKIKKELVRTRVVVTVLIGLAAASQAQAQVRDSPYPQMAPIDQYMMARDAEITLARSAAPKSISRDAEILVMQRNGYKTAIKGSNGFVCLVQRSWTAGIDDPEFWNPKLRAPICFNPPAARYCVRLAIKKTEWILNGQSKAQMFESVKAAIDKGELSALEAGAMCFMMSRQGYLNDRSGSWHPHLMFFVPRMEPAAWGADLPGSPVIGYRDDTARISVFMVPVNRWSDEADATPMDMNGSKKGQL
jgi:hypothetical protein